MIISDEILELSRRVRRLMISSRDPEEFHIEKDDIVHALRCIAYLVKETERPRVAKTARILQTINS